MSGIFISHTHSDQAVADALTTLIKHQFFKHVEVYHSSKKELAGGPAPGQNWFNWIVQRVRETDVAFILLTPSSIQKPWVIWEGGAVAGAAFATPSADNFERVIPIAYGIGTGDVPSPFAQTQIVSGTSASDIRKLVQGLFNRYKSLFSNDEIIEFGSQLNEAVKSYLAQIQEVLLKLPLLPTEGAIQEWLFRLEQLAEQKRFSEAAVMENWLDVAFGRDDDDRQIPLDLRIHRRLGELYASGKQAAAAARQFELASKLVPRDIYILRRLGKAYLDKGDIDAARSVLKKIEEFDPRAFEVNPENAALKARLCEDSKDLSSARDVLLKAFENNPSSYYLGDLLGQILVGLQDLDRARETYTRVQRILIDLREQNVWTCATGLTAAIVCKDDNGVGRWLDALRQMRPTRENMESVERGVGKLIERLQGDRAILDQLRAIELEQRAN